jgi:hypothetical protein
MQKSDQREQPDIPLFNVNQVDDHEHVNMSTISPLNNQVDDREHVNMSTISPLNIKPRSNPFTNNQPSSSIINTNSLKQQTLSNLTNNDESVNSTINEYVRNDLNDREKSNVRTPIYNNRKTISKKASFKPSINNVTKKNNSTLIIEEDDIQSSNL